MVALSCNLVPLVRLARSSPLWVFATRDIAAPTRARYVLLAAQVAVAVTFLAIASLLVHSITRLNAGDRGYAAEGITSIRLRAQGGRPMTTQQRYAMPVDAAEWTIPSRFDSLMRWEYEDGRDSLLRLYEKGKERQWNGSRRIDWSLDLDPENPQGLPDEAVSIFGSDVWNRMTRQERATTRRHQQAWQLSQFLHGEQGALVCTAKIVQQVPSVDAKFYAATQVMDEARHVETYSRLLHEKFELAYPITPTLKKLLEDVLSDSRWDLTYLGMQVLIEGLALAAFASIRDQAKNSLAAAVNAYVM